MSLKNSINNFLGKLIGYKLIHKDFDIHLQLNLDDKYGHRLSRETNQSIDSDNNPIPWITYPAFEYLDQFDLKDKSVFEWGSGNSSLYFSSKCKKITSVETDKTWFDRMKNKSTKNLELVLREIDMAAKSIHEFDGNFDLILIDSTSNRYECAIEASLKLKPGGLIILDNSDRHLKAAEYLNSKGYLQVDMHGFSPIVKYTSTTSLFFDRNFNWKILGDRQPNYSKASIKESAL